MADDEAVFEHVMRNESQSESNVVLPDNLDLED
jgi:hypothetical protein